MSVPFQPYRPRAATGAAPPAPSPAAPAVSAAELARLRRTTVRLSKRFAVANAAFLAVMVLLACTADGLLDTEVAGRLNLGMLLGLAQGVLLLGTAVWFDRRSAGTSVRTADRRADRPGVRDTGGQGPGGAHGWQPVEGHPAPAQSLPTEELYQRWDSYLYAGDQPGVRPADNGPVGR